LRGVGLRERSEPLRPQQRVGEVEQQAYRDETGERIIEDHGSAPSELFRQNGSHRDQDGADYVDLSATEKRGKKSEPFAGEGVTDRRHEEAEAEGKHDNIQHGVLLYGVIHGAEETPLHWAEKWHPARRFSRRSQ
jgi:hypothetical protein